eukprot:1162152-Pelagomonas_calceolata.AAC.1
MKNPNKHTRKGLQGKKASVKHTRKSLKNAQPRAGLQTLHDPGSYTVLGMIETVCSALRSRHLGYWNQFTAPDPRVSNSKRLTSR